MGWSLSERDEPVAYYWSEIEKIRRGRVDIIEVSSSRKITTICMHINMSTRIH